MATVEERHKILEMVAAGKISAQEAASLLNATAPDEVREQVPRIPAPPETPDVPAKAKAREALSVPVKETQHRPATGASWLRIRVNDLTSGRNKVSVNIPLRLMRVGLQLGSSFAPELRNVDWDTLSTSLAEGEGGLLVEVQDEEDGEHVRIFVE